MPVNFRKKNRRMRGKTTHGWGTKKKHRGSGSRGGAGWGGAKKHKKTFIYSYEPEHFGKKGFFSLHKKLKYINIEDLNKIVERSEAQSASKQADIDLTSMGYDKLLSRGKINRAITVTVSSSSAKAKEKIEKAGGKVLGGKE
ncbi:MAG: uL15 family ribosomal protein [Candidatus Aenigmarchaeota archaeon]|nr:uL15 family ribosomal protein [Candidatus Aenigmarchaeota archaeon]